ncbi:MAG: transglycosylase domain-containing protein [Lachnospiraceae bacterium]
MKRRHPVRRFFSFLLITILCITSAAGIFFGVKGYKMYREANAQMSIEERFDEVRSGENFTKYADLPGFYIDAVISVEDHRFRRHPGIDFIAVCRAAWTDIKAMSFEEGGSTITQQLAKNMLFTQEKKMERKAAEVFAVLEIESKYSKEEILELYVNTSSFGSGYYGIYDAAQGYFKKNPSELTDYEAAMLAGVPNAPSVYSPDVSMELAAKRVGQVLKSMVKYGHLTQKEADKIQSENFY